MNSRVYLVTVALVIALASLSCASARDQSETAAYLLSLDPDTRAENWRVEPGGSGLQPPIVVGDTVVVVDYAGSLGAYDAATGDRLWATTVAPHVLPVPVPAHGLVVVAGLEYGKAVLMLDARTGVERWASPDPLGHSIRLRGETLSYFLRDDSAPWSLRGVDVVSGRPLWTIPIVGTPTTPPAWYDDSSVVVATHTTFARLAVPSGQPIFSKPVGHSEGYFPVEVPGAVVALHSTMGSDGVGRLDLSGFDADTGAKQWSSPLDADLSVASQNSATNERIQILRDRNTLVALSPADGSELWAQTVIEGRLSAGAGTIYLGGYDDAQLLVALDPASGAERWRHALPGQGYQAYVVETSDGTLIVTSDGVPPPHND